jgi:hypothetical protein
LLAVGGGKAKETRRVGQRLSGGGAVDYDHEQEHEDETKR